MPSQQFTPLPSRNASEPPLQDLLDDPTLHLLMDRDGISLDDLNDFLAHMRARLIAKRWRQAA